MNSASGDYTICNLDNNTYTTNYSADTGGLGPAHYGLAYDINSAALHEQYVYGEGMRGEDRDSGVLDLVQRHHHVLPEQPRTDYMDMGRGEQPHPGYGMQAYAGYYGPVLTDAVTPEYGCYPADHSRSLASCTVYATGQRFPMTTGHECSDRTNDQVTVATYKWMTVKRNSTKTGEALMYCYHSNTSTGTSSQCVSTTL